MQEKLEKKILNFFSSIKKIHLLTFFRLPFMPVIMSQLAKFTKTWVYNWTMQKFLGSHYLLLRRKEGTFKYGRLKYLQNYDKELDMGKHTSILPNHRNLFFTCYLSIAVL